MKLPLLTLLLLPSFLVSAAQNQYASESPWARPEVRNALVAEEAMLPVSSELLSPGEVAPRRLELTSMAPFFLIGSDQRSLQWLQTHANRLRQMGAAGLAVEVGSADDLAQLRAVAPGLIILPVNGDDIARRLQLEHYPILITNDAIEQ